ncbi:MAG TPA: alpha/beta fold hydrolase [Solirubrobacteraceae bacterium]|nr:alpha/beta fold hydrolase [Solirubrobacteraceae bacterium]
MASRSSISFPSGGSECAAWAFRPEAERPPVVILGHGLGATREMRLEAYATRFAEAGIAAFAFTYRHFGDSGGQPRQLLDIGHQLEDWAAALRYVRGLPDVDTGRIAIWGSSFGGGHVLEIAARDAGVAAVVSQNPFTDGPASVLAANRLSLIRATVPALRDEVARLTGSAPVLVPVVGPPGSAALMATDDAESGYLGIVPPELDFVNGVAARFLLRVGLYRPGRAARRVKVPILFCLCEHDSVAPAAATRRYARKAPRAEVKSYPIGHFEIYSGPGFEQAVADQTGFLERHLRPGAQDAHIP